MTWKKNFNAEVEDDKSSKINAAGLINTSLEKLWLEAYGSMSGGSYHIWNTKLDAIWAILGGDEKESGDVDKKMNDLNLELYSLGSFNSKVGSGFSQKSNPNNSMQYQFLLKKSLFLRRLQNKQGKGTAYENEDDDDFD